MNPPIAKALNRCIVKLSPGCTGTRFKNSTAQRLLTAGLCLFLNFALSIFNTAGQPTNNIRPGSSALMVDTNGVLIAPTNFFSANSNRLNTAVSGGGGGGSGSVTNFSTGAFPAWLTPSVTGATSNPALSIAGNSAMSNLNNGNGAALTNLNAPRLTRTNINLINQPFTGANGTLPAGWAYSKGLGSTGTAYITNNALVITNAVGTPAWNWVYDTNVFNGSHNFSMHCNFSIKQTNGVADALVMGTKSGNPQDDASWGIGAYLMPGAYTGTLIFYGGPSTNLATFRPSDTGSASSNAYPVTITIGTSYGFDIQVDDDSVAASVSNTVTGEVSTFAWKQDVSITTGTNGYFGCSGYFGVQSWGGSFSVTNFQVNLTVPQTVDCLIWGDSIGGTAAKAADYGKGWASLISERMAARGMSTVVFGYSSDTSVEAGNELAEALLMNPKLVLFAAGGNDLANGITNYLTNLPAIKAAFTNATVVWVAPTARGATDMSPLARWMLTNAPGSYIDAYSATKGAYNVTGSGTFSAYVGPDNVHPNTEGHWAVFTVARNWLRAHGWFVP